MVDCPLQIEAPETDKVGEAAIEIVCVRLTELLPFEANKERV